MRELIAIIDFENADDTEVFFQNGSLITEINGEQEVLFEGSREEAIEWLEASYGIPSWNLRFV